MGSLISQGVYSIATPFQPFGGAVDIIVVEQEDGTYRSTPWYVRFGKFQGIIKGSEKVVTISVNGVEADFHMYLDHTGQAYFMREVEPGDSQSSSQVSLENSPRKHIQDDTTGNNDEAHEPIYKEHRKGEGNDEHSFQCEHSSPDLSCPESPGYSNYNNYGNLEDVDEMVKSSNDINSEMVLISVDGHVLTAPISVNEEKMVKSTNEINQEMVLISVDGHVLTAPISANEEESTNYVQSTDPQFHLGPAEGTSGEFGVIFDELEASAFDSDNTFVHQFDGHKYAKGDSTCNEDIREDGNCDIVSGKRTGEGASVGNEAVGEIIHSDTGSSAKVVLLTRRHDDLFKSCLDLASQAEDSDLQDEDSDPQDNLKHSSEVSSSSGLATKETAAMNNGNCRPDALQCISENRISVDSNQEHAMNASDASIQNSDENSPATSRVTDSAVEASGIENTSHTESADIINNSMKPMDIISIRSEIEGDCGNIATEMSTSGVGFELSLCGSLLCPGMGQSSADEAFEAHRISEEEFKEFGPSIIHNVDLIVRYMGDYLPWDKAAYIVLGKAAFGSKFSDEPHDSVSIEHMETPKMNEDAYVNSPISRRWRLWPIPFRRASLQHTNSNSSSEEYFVDTETNLQSPRAEQSSKVNNNQSPRKNLLRTNIPTNEQIASLNLKDGQNIIAFSFSTRVLGKQEVDAHIYLWKWNARIVISDVDGTITKSDVLGQVMPLVGKDWSQSGVAGLFSAIKENGYQLLFLSARAIVQAYLTRSFLLNLKQDGKTLPSGPIVISPDGLFPSLYREVIRRAPHEFKIACLEDIKALFPSDYNPFYAGFGNRDTDEFSYRKIGIPKGKIFIINPKGEVAINHCIDVKSYTSLHTLVNDMFPPTSLAEQEDFNSWNYWKMPMPEFD